MDHTERDLRDKVVALRDKSDSVLGACKAQRKSTLNFLKSFIKKLDEVSESQGGGMLFPDDNLKRSGNELLQVSQDMSNHITAMLMRLEELTVFVEKSKDSEKKSLRKKIWDWLVRAFTALKQFFLTGAHAVIAPAKLIIGTCVSSHATLLCVKFRAGKF